MTIIDIHTHNSNLSGNNAIHNLTWPQTISDNYNFMSAGIHPWNLTETNVTEQKTWLKQIVENQTKIIAIGEGGLDSLSKAPIELQMNVFRMQIELSAQLNIPLIIHVVKQHAAIIALKREYKPHNPWIIHGFRGKKELTQQYLRENCYLSFGAYFNKESLQMVPAEKLFLETDTSRQTIDNIYETAAQIRKTDSEDLKYNIQQNIKHCFFRNNSCFLQ